MEIQWGADAGAVRRRKCRTYQVVERALRLEAFPPTYHSAWLLSLLCLIFSVPAAKDMLLKERWPVLTPLFDRVVR